MLGSELFGNTNLRTWVRGVCRVGALCGVLAMVMLTAGCPVQPPCEVNADCDDNNGCTTDVCDNGICIATADCDGDHCIISGNNETCVECIATSECNDNDACTTDVCDASGTCTNTAIDCNDDNACTTDSCNADGTCSNVAIVCDDSNLCTDDTCAAASGCVFTPTVVSTGCDDGNFCDGAEACDPATGLCAEGTPPCTDDQTCDEAADMCRDGTPCTGDSDCPNDGNFCNGTESCGDDGFCASSGDPCTAPATCDETLDVCLGGACEADGDCDDSNFCNGTETCDVTLMVCIAGTSPCTATQTCVEASDTCQDPTGETLELTLNIDNLTGTDAADMFSAPVALSNGVQTPTLGIGDTLAGGGSADTLTATLVGTNGTISATISDVETFNFTDFSSAGSWTITGATVTGLERINAVNSLNTFPLIFTNLGAVVDVGLMNTNSGMTLNYTTAATMGNADSMSLNLSNVQGGTLTVVSANTNGVESLSVDSSGVANTLAAITQTTGTTLTSMAVTGTQNLTITGALPATVATVNASAATGNVNVDVSANTGTLALTGGSGNDTFTVGANYTSADVVNGGDGTGDVLGLTSATVAAGSNQTNVTNIEGLTVSNALANAFTASRFGSIATVNLSNGVGAAVTATVASGTTFNFNAGTDSAADFTVDVPGLGTSDSVSFNLNDHDTANAFIFTGVETLNVVSNNNTNGTAADGGLNNVGGALTVTNSLSASGIVNVSGAANLTLTGAVTAATLNASTFTGNLVMATPSAGAITITSNTGNDTLFGSAANDVMSAGTGTNVLEGRQGVDSITLGTGVDTIRIAFAGANGADRKIVTGFTAGAGGDVLNIDADDLNTLDGTDNFATSASIQAHSTAGALAVAAATEIVRVTSATVPNLTAAGSLDGTNLLVAIGGAITVQANGNEHLFVVADASGNVGVYYGDAGADMGVVAAELTLIAVLPSVTIANLVFGNFSNAN